MTVIELGKFKLQKAKEKAIAEGKVPLMHTDIPSGRPPAADDFAERIMRIKSSLEKINQLMSELKKQSNKGET